ncbi:AAA family ATPase [uncultured Acinetobacter sp.]|uniref:McrB family protein n=1 Tax=uncultured Acinetobacter sp. TaxID=165433 RepID=UPI00258D5D37|nr:AAA family ATPase [uncultured Acinetobacter sp.]
MSYFSIRTNAEDSIEKILNNESTITIPGITWQFEKVQINDLVFVVISGDESKKKLKYSNGLKVIAKVTGKKIDEYKDDAKKVIKSYSINLNILSNLPKVLTKRDFYLYPDLLDCTNIGPETKGSPNQALGSIDDGLSVLAAVNDLLPEVLPEELLNLIPNNYSIQKAFLKSLDESSLNQSILDRTKLVKEFVNWFFTPENEPKKSYTGLVQEKILLSWDALFFDDQLFNLDLNNLELSIEKIKKIKATVDKEDSWKLFNDSTSNGAPKAVLGENNYIKFLQEFDFSKYISIPEFTIEDIKSQGCFIENEKLRSYIQQLNSKKNIILQGPPGTGKTWLAQQLAKIIVKYPTSYNIQNVQFHPNYAYEDLIRGWRPRSDGKLDLIDGPFLKMIELSKKKPQQNFVFIFDEINRGDPSVIFGEMLTLLENSKRDEKYSLSLTYRRNESEKIYIPENLYVIGTMNTADKSLNNIDFAFRRRFSFFTLEPLFDEAWKNWLKSEFSIEEDIINKIEAFVKDLNNDIKQKNGSQYLLGHSFFVPFKRILTRQEQEIWVKNVIENDIKPLLTEYWYDDLEKVNSISLF